MALDQSGFATIIENMLLGYNPTATDESKAQIATFANDLASEITTYIQSATVTVPASGLVAPNGAVTGSATGSIS